MVPDSERAEKQENVEAKGFFQLGISLKRRGYGLLVADLSPVATSHIFSKSKKQERAEWLWYTTASQKDQC